MPRTIRDSEDEDEEEFVVPDDNAVSKPSQQSSISWIVAEAVAVLAQDLSQDEQSSLSTGQSQSIGLLREILINHRWPTTADS